MKSLSCSMKKLPSCLIVGILTLAAGDFCYAQNSELHVTVMWDGFGRGGLVPVTNFDIELSSEGYSYEGKYNHINTTAIYHDVPEGRLAIRIDNASLPEIKPFSDSITVHKGTNAVIIEMDSSGEKEDAPDRFRRQRTSDPARICAAVRHSPRRHLLRPQTCAPEDGLDDRRPAGPLFEGVLPGLRDQQSCDRVHGGERMGEDGRSRLRARLRPGPARPGRPLVMEKRSIRILERLTNHRL